MKLLLSSFLFLAVLLPSSDAPACVGKTIVVGVGGTPRDLLLAELVSVLVNERTGTRIEVRTFDSQKAAREAATRGEVGLLIEDTGRSARLLGLADVDAAAALAQSKEAYRSRFNLVWLPPFGEFAGDAKTRVAVAPLLTVDVVTNFPVLPRVVGKLAKAIDEKAIDRMRSALDSGGKARQLATEFLRDKRLI